MSRRANQYQPSTYLSFDGKSNSYVALAATNVLPDATAACSFAVWVYLSPLDTGSTDGIRDVIGNRRDSQFAGWIFKIANKARDKVEFTFYDQNSSPQGWISNVSVPYYRWAHIGLSFDGRQVIFYIDGNADPKETVGVAKTIKEYTGQNLRIGHRQAAGSTFETLSGKMSQLGVWDRVLTAAEFQNLYQLRATPTGYRAFWPMDAGSGSTVADSGGNFNGTITGGVTRATAALNTQRTAAGARTRAGARTAAGTRTVVA